MTLVWEESETAVLRTPVALLPRARRLPRAAGALAEPPLLALEATRLPDVRSLALESRA